MSNRSMSPLSQIEVYPLIVAATAAYRNIIEGHLRECVRKYGLEFVTNYFNSDNMIHLLDAFDSRFVTRIELTRFYKDNASMEVERLGSLYRDFRGSNDIVRLSTYYASKGYADVADDILFFIESRIKSARIELIKMTGVTAYLRKGIHESVSVYVA